MRIVSKVSVLYWIAASCGCSAALAVCSSEFNSFAEIHKQGALVGSILSSGNRPNSCSPSDVSKGNGTRLPQIGQFQESYTQILRRAAKLKINPHSFNEYAALRFINRPDWKKYRVTGAVDPREVYDPKPKTWNDWWATAETQVRQQAESATPLTVNMIKEWNRRSLDGTHHSKAGEWTSHTNSMDQTTQSLTPIEIAALDELKRADGIGKNARFMPLVCAKDLPKDFGFSKENESKDLTEECRRYLHETRDASILNLPAKYAWRDLNGGNLASGNYACWPRPKTGLDQSQCGVIWLVDKDEVQKELDAVVADVETYLSCPEKQDLDPIAFATHMQRRYVSIHPWRDGNGRTSRWLMDYILMRSGLPPLLIKDMDRDATTPDEQYSKQAIEGTEEALKIMQDCISNLEKGVDVKNTVCEQQPQLEPIKIEVEKPAPAANSG